MPDLLAHVLIAYSLCILLSWHYGWIDPGYLTVGMAGAFIPDLTKIAIVVPRAAVENLLGIPFDWTGIHTFGGTLVGIAIGAALVNPSERKRVAALLGVGAGSHLVADTLLLTPSGRSYAVFWPLTRWHPPSPGVYHSTDPAPAIVTGIITFAIYLVTKRRPNA